MSEEVITRVTAALQKRMEFLKREIWPAEVARINIRVLHLVKAKVKMKARLEATPLLEKGSGKSRKTREKVAQINASLHNFEQYGFERPPDGRPVGALIGIP